MKQMTDMKRCKQYKMQHITHPGNVTDVKVKNEIFISKYVYLIHHESNDYA